MTLTDGGKKKKKKGFVCRSFAPRQLNKRFFLEEKQANRLKK